MSLKTILHDAGFWLKGLIFKVDQEIQFKETANPEIDTQGGPFVHKIKTGETTGYQLRDDVKGQAIFTVNTATDEVTIHPPYSVSIPSSAVIFVTPAQSVVTAATALIAHGLGAEPDLVQAYLQCTTAEQGYAIGDKINIDITHATSGGMTGRGIVVRFDATNIEYRMGNEPNVFRVLDFNTGDSVNLNNANWSLYIKAIKL